MGNNFEDYAKDGFITVLIDIIRNTRSDVKKDQADKYKKLAIDALYQIADLCPEIFAEDLVLLAECIQLLEPGRTDKILPVRTASMETQKLLKKIQMELTDESGSVDLKSVRLSSNQKNSSAQRTATFPST